jgi:mannose-1-phosphate guanylyltransferase/mannose-6-phosphate isomerase
LWKKPTAEVAEALVADSRYLWNSGMFIARARTFLEETRTHAPQVFDAVQQAVSRRVADLDFERLDPASFCTAPDISVDYAIAERTKLAATVPGDFGWSDIGSWDALWELSPKDVQGNAVYGDVFLDDARNCYVRSEGILTTVCGVKDLVVVSTRDAVMISHRERAQDVKKMVARLIQAGRQEATAHNRIYRPLGVLRRADSGRAVSGQAHCGAAGAEAVVAKALPPCRALGGGGGHGPCDQGAKSL